MIRFKYKFLDFINKGVIVVNDKYEIRFYNQWIKSNFNLNKKAENKNLFEILPSNLNFLKNKISNVLSNKNVLYISYALHNNKMFFKSKTKKILFNIYIFPFDNNKILIYFDNITNYINNLNKIKELNRDILNKIINLEIENKKNLLIKRFADIFNESNPLKDISIDILKALNEFYPNTKLTFYLFDELNSELKLINSLNIDKEIVNKYNNIKLFYDNFLTIKALKSEKLLFIEDIEKLKEEYETLKNIKSKSIIFIPLFDFNKNQIGFIHIGFSNKKIFKNEEKEFMKLISKYIAIGISKLLLSIKLNEHNTKLSKIIEEKTKELEISNSQLKEMLFLYSTLIESQSEIICKLEEYFKISFANKSFFNFFKKEKNELINKNFLDLLDVENKAKFIDEINKINKNNKESNIELNFKIGKERRVVQFNIKVIRNKENNFIPEYQLVGRDITRKIKAENIINEQKEVIRKKEKLSMLGRVSASIIHEINTPLTYIKTNSELINSHIIDMINKIKNKEYDNKNILDDLNELLSYNNDIFNGTNRIWNITNSMKSFIKGEVEKEVFDIKQLIYEVLNITYQKWYGIVKISKNIQDSTKIYCIKGQIEQVLINLFLNAIDAVSKKAKREISINARNENNLTIIEIEDNGIGISKNNINKIFNPLFSTKIGNEGTGLGLSIVKEIIEAHKGIIDVFSEPNKGTKFTIKLPLKEDIDV